MWLWFSLAWAQPTPPKTQVPAPVDEAWPPGGCLTAYGQTACGYDCRAAHGQVRCANAPWGRCEVAFGQVVCGPELAPGQLGSVSWPQATCLAAFGQIACGWGCVAHFGQVACARHPEGRCVVTAGALTCTPEPRLVIAPSAGGTWVLPVCTQVRGTTVCVPVQAP